MRESVFGIPIRYETWDKQDSLPLYIAGSYDFCIAYIAEKRCLIVKPVEELVTLPALKSR